MQGKICVYRASVYLHLKAVAQTVHPASSMRAIADSQLARAAQPTPAKSAPLSPARQAMSDKERRETAILATDDAPFSIYKS